MTPSSGKLCEDASQDCALLSFSNYTEKTFEIRLFSSLLYRGRKKVPSYIFPEFSSYCENFLIFYYFWIQGLPVFNCKFVICIMLWFLEFELFVYCFGEEIQIKMGHLVKFIYSEKATNFCEIFTLLLTVCTVVKSGLLRIYELDIKYRRPKALHFSVYYQFWMYELSKYCSLFCFLGNFSEFSWITGHNNK